MNKYIDKIKVFSNIDSATKKLLCEAAKVKTYKRGEHLFLDREKVTNLYFIVEGVAALYKIGPSLDKKVIFIHGNGDTLNEVILQENISSLNCEILKSSKILEINAEKLKGIMKTDFILCENIIDSMASKIRRMFHQLKNTSNSVRLDRQIASKLWKLSRDFGIKTEDGTEIGFNLSISYLADIVGSKRETVSKQLKTLSEEGLIKVKRNKITVVDRENLLNYFRKP